jgi:hypothetical protein
VQLLGEPLRRLVRRGRLVVAASEAELRLGSRRGLAIDAHGVAEQLLAGRVLEDSAA